MMRMLTFPALVIRITDYGENDGLLTLLTGEYGKITVLAKGIKSLKNKSMAASQLLCYSEFTVKERGGYYTLSEASLVCQFFGFRSSVVRYSLAQYAADVAGEVTVENEDASEMLSLTLNTLYVLADTDKDPDLIKAVFEIRCMAISGYQPILDGCYDCGTGQHPVMYLDVMNGHLVCGDCFGREDDGKERPADIGTAAILLPLAPPVLAALRYITGCPPKKLFGFSIDPADIPELARVTEKYLVNQLERSFYSLEFYNKVKDLEGI